MLKLIGIPNVGLHLDTFHMNIEERSIPGSIKKAGKNFFISILVKMTEVSLGMVQLIGKRYLNLFIE